MRIFDYLVSDKGFVGLISWPQALWSSLWWWPPRGERFFYLFIFIFYYVFWDFLPHLLCGRSTWCVVATWCDLRGEINALLRVTLGFPIVFQFSVPNFLNFSTVHFPFHFSQLPIITLSFFLSKLLVIFSEPVCSVAKFPTSSFWGMPFFLSLFFFYGIDIEYDKFLFLFLFYLFI